MGNVVYGDWSWKGSDPGKKKIKSLVKTRKLVAKRKKRAEKGLGKRQKIDRIRGEVLKHFSLHKFSSWVALADMICEEQGLKPVGTKTASRKLVMRYGKSLVAGKKVFKPRTPSDVFYSSTSWRELRYIALKNSNGTCTLCGARASDGVSLHVDHIVPRSIDARKELDLDNLQILCDDCNIGKSNRDCIDWRS